jgi:PrsW family intramembrane metalloprotease
VFWGVFLGGLLWLRRRELDGLVDGIAVRRRNLMERVLLLPAGYLAAVVLHALWNISAGFGSEVPAGQLG